MPHSIGYIFLVPARIYCFKSWNRRSKSGFSPSSENSWIRWENIDFRFNYTPECMVSSMHFYKIFWKGLTQHLHRLLPPAAQSLAAPSGACAIDRFGFRPQFTPSTMFINSSSNRRELDQTLFPNPNFLSYNYIYAIEKLLTAGWENFLKIH